mmetsp:Transcript_28271/g.91146  ORF Transcript_28271/g.91146 Transcript_28271/m.91146 type:complete len:123 (+) Transcript_28271:492-860(+)
MQLMVEGDKWELYIPSDLAYGERGSPPKIPGGSALIFQMEIIEIDGDTVPAAAKCDVITLDKCDDKEKAYLEKIKAKDPAAELKRLKAMDPNKMKADLATWLTKRIALLTKLTNNAKPPAEL